MHCTKKITDSLTWIGGNDRRLAMFEGVYSVPGGVSYNSYLLEDEKTVIFDTVDKAVSKIFFENIKYILKDREPDYLVVHHMEPDHSASLEELLVRYPRIKVVCNSKIAAMIKQFFDFDIESNLYLVNEGDRLSVGKHILTFINAPMVHWPEVMVSYEETEQILFSADAFGHFGALNGAIFADEVDFDRDYLDEARRYYSNIVGKYGTMVQSLLKKMSALNVSMICPLHGFVWRKEIDYFVEKYKKWSAYIPEENGVVIAYASIYGNTENAAETLSSVLRDRGIKTEMYDVSVTPASDIISAAFKYSHIILASPTYNAGIFVTMEALVRDIEAHNIQNRTYGFMQNGSWAPASGKLMKDIISSVKNVNIIESTVDIRSSVKSGNLEQINAMADEIVSTMPKREDVKTGEIENSAMFTVSYGLYALFTKDVKKDNACIINTVLQVTDNPKRISICVNKSNYSNTVLMNTGVFNISVLSEKVPFDIFKRFGFVSGRDTNKLEGFDKTAKSENGLLYLTEYSNAFISAKIIDSKDYGTHTLFVADVTEAKVLNSDPSVTYSYYFANIKPKPEKKTEQSEKDSGAEKKIVGWRCKICGYEYEGEQLPEDFICPLCKHPASDFEPVYG